MSNASYEQVLKKRVQHRCPQAPLKKVLYSQKKRGFRKGNRRCPFEGLERGRSPLLREGFRKGNRRCPFLAGPPGFEPGSKALFSPFFKKGLPEASRISKLPHGPFGKLHVQIDKKLTLILKKHYTNN